MRALPPVRRLFVVPLLLVVGGCSDAGRDVSEPAAGESSAGATPDRPIDRAALAEEIAGEFSGDHATPALRKEGRCFADALLDRAGPEQLRSAGLVDAEGHLVLPLPTVSDDLATTWVEAQEQCSDFVTSSTEALFAQSKGKLDREAYAACLRRTLSEDEMRAGLVAAITGDLQSEEVAALSEAQADCAGEALPQD